MPHINPLPMNEAPEGVQELYEDFRARMIFPSAPNFIMTQGHSLTVARGTWSAVFNVLVSGKIPRWVKELIFVAISKDRGCLYCEAAHIACCRMLGVDRDVLDSLIRNVQSLANLKVRDMITFALKCSKNPRSLTPDDYATLRRHGLADEEIMEVIGMSALAVYANIIADATAMEPDAIFDQL
jgi:uncharacterized peroxidase-related enzyme